MYLIQTALFSPIKRWGGKVDQYGSAQVCREKEKEQPERTGWIGFYSPGLHLQEKKKMYISIYRMVKEYTSFAVAQWKDDYKVVFLLFDLIWFFFFLNTATNWNAWKFFPKFCYKRLGLDEDKNGWSRASTNQTSPLCVNKI